MFGHALQTGQMGPVIEQFNMGEAVSSAATRGGSFYILFETFFSYS